MSSIGELQAWFESQCDGIWEHRHGVSIQSCDNPGWIVKIDTFGTDLEGRSFDSVAKGLQKHNVFEEEWLRCSVDKGIFIGAGSRLDVIIEIFLKWVAQR